MKSLLIILLCVATPVIWSQPTITGKSTTKPLNLTYAEPSLALSAVFVDDNGTPIFEIARREGVIVYA